MASHHSLDRRKHHGPFRFIYMDLSTFLHRFLGIHPRRR
jgi:hypothetical protein